MSLFSMLIPLLMQRLFLNQKQIEEFKSSVLLADKIAVIGMPQAGKTTLVSRLWKDGELECISMGDSFFEELDLKIKHKNFKISSNTDSNSNYIETYPKACQNASLCFFLFDITKLTDEQYVIDLGMRIGVVKSILTNESKIYFIGTHSDEYTDYNLNKRNVETQLLGKTFSQDVLDSIVFIDLLNTEQLDEFFKTTFYNK